MIRAARSRMLFLALVGGAALALAPTQSLAQDFFSDLFRGFEGRPTRGPRWEPRRPRYEPRWEPRPRRDGQPPHRREQQQKQSGAKPTLKPVTEPVKASIEPPPPPYDAQVQRLAEILGGLSYLRDLCGDGDGDDWRNKMAKLREADAPTGARRVRLTAAFNRGFTGYELTYRACTPNARLAIVRYLDEAEQIASGVATRYGNP